MFKKLAVVMMAILSIALLAGCSYDQEDYYEVHVIEGDAPFRYVNPDEGKELHSKNEFSNEDTYFLYLYAPEADEIFTYEQFFSALGEYFVYRQVETGKYYVKYVPEMETVVFQFHVDKEAFENPA